MQKPSGYDEVQTIEQYTPVDLGGHYAVIKQVSERRTENGKDMIVVLFDFCKPDKQAEYFKKQFENNDRKDKKWPFTGSKYIMINDYNDPTKTSKAFKTFCTCAEKSNGMSIVWNGNGWGKQFTGKKIGVVFGEEEHEYNGKISMRHNPKWFCVYDKVGEQDIPRPKYLNGSSPSTAPAKTDDGFMDIPNDSTDEEIPF